MFRVYTTARQAHGAGKYTGVFCLSRHDESSSQITEFFLSLLQEYTVNASWILPWAHPELRQNVSLTLTFSAMNLNTSLAALRVFFQLDPYYGKQFPFAGRKCGGLSVQGMYGSASMASAHNIDLCLQLHDIVSPLRSVLVHNEPSEEPRMPSIIVPSDDPAAVLSFV